MENKDSRTFEINPEISGSHCCRTLWGSKRTGFRAWRLLLQERIPELKR